MEKPVILIVDDEPLNIAILSQLLKETYRVRACKSGVQTPAALDMDAASGLRSLRGEGPFSMHLPEQFAATHGDDASLMSLQAAAGDRDAVRRTAHAT